MKVLRKMKAAFFNIFVYKVVLMFFLIPTLLVPMVQYNYKLLFVMMAWGAILCLYDLFHERKFMKAQGMLWLLLFLISFAVSIILNFQNSFNLNFSSWAYTVIALLLLYPDHTGNDKEKVLKELTVINYIFLWMTTVLSTLSFVMFAVRYSKLVEYGDQVYVIGWGNSRLFGLYWNTGFMITAIGLAVLVIQWLVLRARKIPLRKRHKAFFIYTAIINFFCMCLENAKGAFLSLAAFLFVFVFFVLTRFLLKKDFSKVKTYVLSVVAAVASVAVLFGAIYVTRTALSYIPSVYDALCSDNMESVIIEREEIEREIPENYGALTGRPYIWRFGIEQFCKKPLFGQGPQSFREYHVVDSGLRHFHNLIIQCLASVGMIGSIFIFIFFLKTVFKSFFLIWKEKNGTNKYIGLIFGIFAFLIMFLVNSMAEVTILFLARFSMFLFWMYLGYLQTLLDQRIKGKDDRLLDKVNQRVFLRLKKKSVNGDAK